MTSSALLSGSFSTWNTQEEPQASFMGIPLDVRRIIYKILLVNPILGLSLSVSESANFGESTQYNLHPNVLAVCRQTNREGVDVLYGLNTFYVAPLPDSFYGHGYGISHREMVICPITRYLSEPDYDYGNIFDPLRGAGNLNKAKALTAVRSWKVVLSVPTSLSGLEAKAPHSLSCFRQAILRSFPRSLDVAIIPEGVQRGEHPPAEIIPMVNMLKPLSHIHNVGTVIFRDAIIFEVPDVIRQDEDALEFHSHMEEEAVLEVQSVEQMQSDVKVEFAFEMYHTLLRYAQAFEQYNPFKQIMAVLEEEYVANDGLDSRDYYEANCEKGNPFHAENVHPVARHVMATKAEAIRNDIKAFKRSRMLVLEYLESQCQRITKAANNLLEFILTEKRFGGLFDIKAQG